MQTLAVAAALAGGAVLGLGLRPGPGTGGGVRAGAASELRATAPSEAAPPANPATQTASPAAGAAGGEVPRVSNVFVETFITQALQDIALQAGVNILVDSAVQGFVTLELKEVPLEQAIRMVLAPGGSTYVKLDDKTYLVGKPDRTSPIFHVLTQTERVRLNYISAEEAKRLLSEYYTPFVRFDPVTNSAVITAAPDLLQRIQSDIERIDRPAPQVEILAVVTEVSEEARRQLGLDGEWKWAPDKREDRLYQLKFGPDGLLSATLQTPYHYILASLKQLVDSGQASIRANPRLTVLDGQTADIFVGEDRYFRIVAGEGTTAIARLESIKAGVSLKITPRISETGEITLQVQPVVTDVTDQVGDDDLPVVSRRQVSTTVRVKDGETLVLGGLVQESRQQVTTQVPLLGDLPVVRYLFSTSRDQKLKSEVVVFVTPRVLPSGQQPLSQASAVPRVATSPQAAAAPQSATVPKP